MRALHVEATCVEDGVITLRNLPVHEGDSVEVVIIARSSSAKLIQERFPLRGELIEYRDPFEPVAENDWEAAR